MIELRGVIQAQNNGHTEVDLVVTEDRPSKYVKHRMGIDVVVNRGRIQKFLGDFYGIPPGEIVWPAHIEL